MNNNTSILYQKTGNFSTLELENYEAFFAKVIKETSAGCIVNLEADGRMVQAFCYGNYRVDDYLLVSIQKTFEDRLPRVIVDSVIKYASDIEYKTQYLQPHAA